MITKKPTFAGLLIVDTLLTAVAYLGAYLIRLDDVFYGLYLPTMLKTVPAVAAVSVVAFVATGLYRSLPRYASLDTLLAVGRSATVAVAGAALVIFVVWRGANVPRSVFVIQWMLMILMMGGVRLWPRLRRYQPFIPLRAARADRIPVLVYGAGDAGEMVVREMLGGRETAYWPVGFLDDDPAKRGRHVHGRPVLGGASDISRIVEESGAREILVAIPSASGRLLRQIVERCNREAPGITIKTLPSLADLIAGRLSVSQFHEVRIDDLLKRAPRDLDPRRVRQFIAGKTVFVTGAGGSIGSELCRQLAGFGVAELIMFEQSEFNLYEIDQEIAERYPAVLRRAVLGDASHRASVAPVIMAGRPQVIFHAAAYKHVPLLEENPCEGVLNNVLGVVNTAEAAHEAGVDDFLFISTDKAVRPVSVMGAAKRAGEIFVQLMAARSDSHFNVVRFGNVLGSSGSVIPKFTDQIRRGLPVTITDPSVTRYFMLTGEAVQLVMQAASLGWQGDIFVLDMGEPVPIRDLALDVAHLMGAVRDGEPEVEFTYTGLRPGEKIVEELFFEESPSRPTGFPSIRVEGHRASLSWDGLRAALDQLVLAARQGSVEDTIRALAELVEEYRPATPEYAEILGQAARKG